MSSYLLYFGLVWILTWFIQSQKIFNYIKWQLFQEMRSCIICGGFWVAFLLFPFFKVNLLSFGVLDFIDNTQIINFVVNAIITSIITSLWINFTKEGYKKLYHFEVIK